MHVVLFFTFDISLKNWKESGLLDREVKIYKNISKESDIKYTFVTYGDESDFAITELSDKISVLPAYTMINYSKNKFIRFLKSFLLPFKLNKALDAVDVIKTNQLNGSWVAIIYKILSRKSLIIRTGFNAHDFAIRQNKSKLIVFGYLLLTQFALYFADIFLVTSTCDKRKLNSNFFLTNKINVRPNWVKQNSNAANKDRYKEKILCVGRLEEQKNYKNLIRSFKNSKFILDIVGDGTLKYELLNLANELNVNINLLGQINNDELLSLYPKYKFFIISSIYEGNPKVVLEAMSAGCIVLGNKIESVEEIIKNNENGFLFSFKNESPLQIINKLNKQPSDLQTISLNAVKSIKENNSIEVISKLEIEDYKKLVKN